MDFRRLGWFLDHLPYRHAPLIEAALGKRGLILDVGGGTGRVARLLSAPRVVVLDRDGGLLARARRHRLPCVRGDARFLPIRSGAVPAVLMVDAFHHMPDQDDVLREAARVLAPGGAVLLEEFDPRSLSGRLVALAERMLGFGSRFHEPDGLAARLRSAGLAARIERWSRRDYAAVGTRP